MKKILLVCLLLAGIPAFAQHVDLTKNVAGTLPVGNGGTGLSSPGLNGNCLVSNGTLWTSAACGGGSMVYPSAGIAKSTGAAWTTPAAAADIYGLWTGTCSASTFLRGDGSCQTPAGSGNVSNTGTPANGQLGVWTAATTLSGVAATAESDAILGTPGAGIIKRTAANTYSAATAGTDYMGLASNNSPTGTNDFSGGVIKAPWSAAYAPTVTGQFGFDSATGAFVWGNGTTTNKMLKTGTLTNGDACTYTSATSTIDCNTALGGSGTVTSVGASFTGGLVSITGSPVTTTGTLAFTVAGTSGGIPYFSSASGWASSAALAANAIVIGGGAGVAPSTTTTGAGVITALGVNTGSAGAFSTIIAKGTSALGTGAITSATCATVVTTAATGTATTDVINWGFNGDPTAVTGYAPATTGMLTIIAYPSAGNVNFKVCNNTASSITPGAITLNWIVLR